ncbi:MAG: hypothetical protein JXA20_14630 [Spirochaetes bacterium]|nr:hypothetical protein [Spirochaetota bacterium]
MKRIVLAALLLSIIIFDSRADADPTMAFGYLTNTSGDSNYDYLETIFPNSFANSLRKSFNINVLKPHEVNRLLAKDDCTLEKSYKDHDMQRLMERVSADFFILGSFVTLPLNRVQITMSMYAKGSNTVFTFTNTGRMETEIFRLVDRIASIMVNFFGRENLYRSVSVRPGARLGIITNIDGADLNDLYYTFMLKGYRIAGMQGNYLKGIVTQDEIERFKFVSAVNNSFDLITDTRTFTFRFGPWAGERYLDRISDIRYVYRVYDLEYQKTRNDVLSKLSARFGGIDNLLIIGFDRGVRRAWVRCLDVREKDLVWMQSNITGGTSGEIAAKMIERMSSPVEE